MRSVERRRRRFARLSRWLQLLVLPAALSVAPGCTDHDKKEPPRAEPTATRVATQAATVVPTATATPVSTGTTRPTVAPTNVPTPDVMAACEKLEACDPCFFINERGECLPTSECVARLTADDAGCVNQVSGCDAQVLGDCLPVGCRQETPGDVCD